MKKDIENIEDIKIMVDEFYGKVQNDELLAPIFNFRLSTYWGNHLEKMYSFWNTVLFAQKDYVGNPFAKHATLPVDATHFERWLSLFFTTIDNHFEGRIAQEAKNRAKIMALTIHKKMLQKVES